jgi:hypothetical protein
MKKIIFLLLFLVLTTGNCAGVYDVHVMTVQDSFWLNCVVLDEKGKDALVWFIKDCKGPNFSEQKEKSYGLKISHEDAESLVALVRDSEDFKKKNLRKKDGSVGLGSGFIIGLTEGDPSSSKQLAVYDLPPDMQSPDLDKLKILIKWEEIKNRIKR